jgi:hypothetical protein
METHVRVLAILHIVLGVIGLLIALVLLVIFGGITGLIGMNAGSDEATVAIPIIGGIGALVVLVVVLLSVPGIIAGVGLLSHRPWARILTLILSVFELFNIPFGTALGFYGFWVLLSKETAPLFERSVSYGYTGPRTS